jgi:hypothetical protein
MPTSRVHPGGRGERRPLPELIGLVEQLAGEWMALNAE